MMVAPEIQDQVEDKVTKGEADAGGCYDRRSSMASPTFEETQLMVDRSRESELRWDRLRSHNGSVQEAFEELCSLLQKYRADYDDRVRAGWRFVRKGKPDSGVECLWRSPAGALEGMQAKWYTTRPTASQWSKIDESIEKALSEHPTLERLTICLPLDPSDHKVVGKKSGKKSVSTLDKWEARVKTWSASAATRGMTVTFEFQGTSELFDQLIEPRHVGRRRYFFSANLFDPHWFRRFADQQIANAGARYTPQLHVTLPIAKALVAVARAPGYDTAISVALHEVNEPWRLLKEELSFLKLSHVEPRCLAMVEMAKQVVATFVDGPADDYVALQPRAQRTYEEVSAALAAALETLPDKQRAMHEPPTPREKFQRTLRVFEGAIADVLAAGANVTALAATTRRLLIEGSGGAGKTHLLCDAARQRTAAGLPTLLYFGQQFRARNPWPQLIGRTGLSFASIEEFLGALDTAGELAGSPSLLVLDALNEVTDDPASWQDELPGMLAAVHPYAHVAVALSIRDSYLHYVIPKPLRASLATVRHGGFTGQEYDATVQFFDHYNISLPDTPFLDPEFANPLFLKVFCEAVAPGPDPHKTRPPARVPPGLAGFSAVFDTFVDRVDQKLVKELGLDIDAHGRPVVAAVDALADAMADRRTTSLPRAQAAAIVAGIMKPRLGGSPMDRLVREQLLDKDYVYEGRDDRRGVEVIRFGYDRFASHLVTARLLTRHVDPAKPLESLAVGRPLRAVAEDGSLLDALLVQFPERFGVELLQVLGTAHAGGHAAAAFLRTLPWRRPSTISKNTVRQLDEVLRVIPGLNHEWLVTLLQLATRPGHPLNGRYLHEKLSTQSLRERDRFFIPLFHRLSRPSEFDEGGPVGRLVAWALAPAGTAAADDETAELAATVLGWLFIVTDRRLRDRATKAMACLLQDRLSTLAALIERFATVNDPYVLERVLAAAYGCCLRSVDRPAIRTVALAVYRLVFASSSPPVDILARDYARGIVEYAAQLKVSDGMDLAVVRPPYRSGGWVGSVPTAKKLKARLGAERSGDSMLWAVWRSLNFEQSLGDFGIYSIGTHWTEFWRRGTPRPAHGKYGRPNPFPLDLPQRYVLDRILALGVTPDESEPRRDSDDFDVGRSRPRIERQGKKYQWIAFREFLARVIDHFDYEGASSEQYRIPYMGPWQLQMRDIDPTFVLPGTHELQYRAEPCWWWPVKHDSWTAEPDSAAWLDAIGDLAEPTTALLARRGGDAHEWVVLGGIINYRDEEPLGGGAERSRAVGYQVDAYVVAGAHSKALVTWLRKRGLRGQHLPEPSDAVHPFWGEVHWAPINRQNEPSLYGEREWQAVEGQPHPIVPLADDYYREHGESDAALEETVRRRIPGRWLCEHGGWRPSREEGRFVNAAGEVVAVDPCVAEPGPSVLLVRADVLRGILRHESLTLVWTFMAEKNLYEKQPKGWPGELWVEGVYVWNGEERVVGSLKHIRTPARA